MSEQIDTLVTDFNKAFADMGTALDNIAADEANLAKQITLLTQQVSDLIDAGGPGGLSNAEFEALVAVRNAATAMAAKTKAIADAVPDPAPPPSA